MSIMTALAAYVSEKFLMYSGQNGRLLVFCAQNELLEATKCRPWPWP